MFRFALATQLFMQKRPGPPGHAVVVGSSEAPVDHAVTAIAGIDHLGRKTRGAKTLSKGPAWVSSAMTPFRMPRE